MSCGPGAATSNSPTSTSSFALKMIAFVFMTASSYSMRLAGFRVEHPFENATCQHRRSIGRYAEFGDVIAAQILLASRLNRLEEAFVLHEYRFRHRLQITLG